MSFASRSGPIAEAADISLRTVIDYLREHPEAASGRRVFDLASTRFHLHEWEQNIRRKLDTVGNVFDLLTQQAGSTRTEVLEIVVILLIATEIILALWRH